MNAAAARGLAVALETSTRAPTVAVRCAERRLETSLSADRPHASDLLPVLARLLGEVGARPDQVEWIAVGTGPGSYTGLRVGIATALGLARACGARLVAVPSTEALAWGEIAPGSTASIALDAHRGELYFARYRRSPAELGIECAPRLVVASELARLASDPGDVLCEDEVAHAAALAAGVEPSRVRSAVPRARALLDLAERRLERDGPSDPRLVEPLYLRAFVAKPARR